MADARSTHRAWQFTTTTGGMEKNLKLNSQALFPKPTPDQHLVKVIAVSLNPADYKAAEIPIIGKLLAPNPGTPGIDFAGRVVAPAADSGLKEGQLVFGASALPPFGLGALSEYASTAKSSTVAIPEGVAPEDAATLPVCGLTGYQTLKPYVKNGDRVFINAGSGGTGIYCIQIAKALGCYVTTTCSAPSAELCKSLGADEVVDYRKGGVIETLKAMTPFNHVIDCAGFDTSLYYRSHEYTTEGAVYVMVAGSPSLSFMMSSFLMRMWPAFLGGSRRRFQSYLTDFVPEQLSAVADLMKEGKIKAVIDSRFPFDQARQAYEKLRTGRSKGKIIVDVDLSA